MFGVYVFCAVVGVPLLLLLVAGGGDVEGEIGGFDVDADVGGLDLGGDVGSDVDFAGADSGFGDASALRRIPMSSYVSAIAFFGGVGVVSTLLDVGATTTLVMAIVLGLLAGFVNTALFGFLRNSQTDSQLSDRQIEGRIATVSVPIEHGRRGRVWIDTGGERLQLTAGSVDNMSEVNFGRGEQVVIVRMDSGVAQVMAVDPDLYD